jgi:hypothetical protein
MNDVTYVEAARKLAERMIVEGGDEPLKQGFRLVLGRAAKPTEEATLRDALAKFTRAYQANPQAAERFLQQGRSAISTSIPAPQLAAYTGVASILLNMDEAVTKE